MKFKIFLCIVLIGFLAYGFFVPVDTGLTDAALIPEDAVMTDSEEESAPEESSEETSQDPEESKPEVDLSSLSAEEREVYSWASLHDNPDSLLMTREQIQNLNATIVQNCDNVIDILELPEAMTPDMVRDFIRSDALPELPKYNEGSAVTQEELDAVIDNENLDGEIQSLALGIVTTRTNLRSLPTDTHFYTSAEDRYYDQIQMSALYCAMPVWVLHTSTDGNWYYVQTYWGRGWTHTSDIATTDSQDVWLSFANPENKIVITDSQLTINKATVDMGCSFSCLEDNGSTYTILLPTRDQEGALTGSEASVAAGSANNGYLDYTWTHFYTQLLRYNGADYGWGDADGGVDGSSFPCFVFRSFGIFLPRDLADQSDHVGAALPLSDLSQNELYDALDTLQLPSLLYSKNGQVSVYLGNKEDAYYMMYAPRADETVFYEEITDTSRLLSVNVIG